LGAVGNYAIKTEGATTPTRAPTARTVVRDTAAFSDANVIVGLSISTAVHSAPVSHLPSTQHQRSICPSSSATPSSLGCSSINLGAWLSASRFRQGLPGGPDALSRGDRVWCAPGLPVARAAAGWCPPRHPYKRNDGPARWVTVGGHFNNSPTALPITGALRNNRRRCRQALLLDRHCRRRVGCRPESVGSVGARPMRKLCLQS
jgi:hypothetical protein